MAGKASASTQLSPSSTWSLSVSALAPATKPCPMPRPSPNASTSRVSSTPPRSPPPYSQMNFDDQGLGRSAVAANTSALGTTSPSPDTQPRATTLATRSCDLPLRPRRPGKTPSSCPSPRPFTTADTLASAAHMCPASRLSRKHRLYPTTLGPPSCPRKMTKIFPSPPSSSTSLTSPPRQFELELHAHHRQTWPAQPVSRSEAHTSELQS